MEILKKIWLILADSFQTILLAASIFLVIYLFIFRPFEVSGVSMYPTFHDKDYILTNILSLHMEKLQRADVIVFIAPPDPTKDYIKRIVGLPGDTVEVQDGSVYVNGKPYDESKYLQPIVKTYGGDFLKDGQSVVVPPKNYFVMGDNRPESSDSREWGFVPTDNIIGKSYFLYFPFTRIRLVVNPVTKRSF